MYGGAYGVQAGAQQWEELGHSDSSSSQDPAQQADWGTAAQSNLFDKSDC